MMTLWAPQLTSGKLRRPRSADRPLAVGPFQCLFRPPSTWSMLTDLIINKPSKLLPVSPSSVTFGAFSTISSVCALCVALLRFQNPTGILLWLHLTFSLLAQFHLFRKLTKKLYIFLTVSQLYKLPKLELFAPVALSIKYGMNSNNESMASFTEIFSFASKF